MYKDVVLRERCLKWWRYRLDMADELNELPVGAMHGMVIQRLVIQTGITNRRAILSFFWDSTGRRLCEKPGC